MDRKYGGRKNDGAAHAVRLASLGFLTSCLPCPYLGGARRGEGDGRWSEIGVGTCVVESPRNWLRPKAALGFSWTVHERHEGHEKEKSSRGKKILRDCSVEKIARDAVRSSLRPPRSLRFNSFVESIIGSTTHAFAGAPGRSFSAPDFSASISFWLPRLSAQCLTGAAAVQ